MDLCFQQATSPQVFEDLALLNNCNHIKAMFWVIVYSWCEESWIFGGLKDFDFAALEESLDQSVFVGGGSAAASLLMNWQSWFFAVRPPTLQQDDCSTKVQREWVKWEARFAQFLEGTFWL